MSMSTTAAHQNLMDMFSELEIGSKQLIMKFSGDQHAILDPLDKDLQETSLDLEMLRGKRPMGCLHGEWLLMLDEGTRECFLLSLVSLTKISLPLLPATVDVALSEYAMSPPTPPDCTIMLSTFDEDYLLYCRPGDEEWEKLWSDETDDEDDTTDIFAGEIVSSQGKMYASTTMSTFVSVDVSMPASYDDETEVAIERRGIPHPGRLRWGCQENLVTSDGDIFLLQFYIYSCYVSEVVDMHVHVLDTTTYVWNKVKSIGDRTIFIGGDCAVISPARPVWIAPWQAARRNVHLLHKDGRNGVRLYTIRPDDPTMRCSLLPGSCNSKMYWVVPLSLKKKFKETLVAMSSSESNNKICKLSFDKNVEHIGPAWSSLPVDMVEELVPCLSFIDYLSVREVCRGWSSISNSVQYGNRYPTYPVLMSICSSSVGMFKLFDPIVEKEYTLVNNTSLVPCNDYFQMLLFAKHGWVLVLRGDKHMRAANPFTGEMLQLPEIPYLGYQFDGISFSSTPKSPDCIVCAIEKSKDLNQDNNCLYAMVWHAGDERWTRVTIADDTLFRAAYSNLVFYHNEFYCLGIRGNLGVFNPQNMAWRVLDKPNAILGDDPMHMPGDQYCHLLEFEDTLFAIFIPQDDGPIGIYKLDMSQMAWTKVERLDNEVIFVDDWNAVMMSAPRDACCNRIYLSKFGGHSEDGGGQYEDLKSGKYRPDYFSWTKQMNSIWVEPKFKC